MTLVSDNSLLNLSSDSAGIELIKPWGERNITHAFHDIDGTHSLIRNWIPAMELVLGWVIENGIDGIENPEAFATKIIREKNRRFPRAEDFAIESAGLSALTQMEWALRSAILIGTLIPDGKPLCDHAMVVNHEIINRIFAGEEHFEQYDETADFRRFLNETSSKLFKIYELLLLAISRNDNLKAAKINPAQWRVPGSMEFLQILKSLSIKNYFVTGAVIEHHADNTISGTMYEEIIALGYHVGKNQMVENLYGSKWDEKISKQKIFQQICEMENLHPENILIIGDGRSEISAGVAMGALTVSRIDKNFLRHRSLHRKLGTNLIVPDYCSNEFKQIFNMVSICFGNCGS
jgi:hypothetical protein